MFDDPEYASYIQLCRELRLKREWQEGDWLWWEGSDEDARWYERPGVHLYALVDKWHGGWEAGIEGWPERAVWLPRLDQWLTMLEEAGERHVGFWWGHPYAAPDQVACGTVGWAESFIDYQAAPGREEAAARLWMAVTGRK